MYFFDLDGTLLDSNGIWLDIDIQFLGLHGISPVPPEYTEYVVHHTFQDAAAYTRRLFSLPLTEEEIIARWREVAREEYAGRLFFLQNNFAVYQDYALVGTKGYTFEGPFYLDPWGNLTGWDEEKAARAEKLVAREIARLRYSFEQARTAGYRKFILFLHYPPTNILEETSPFTEIAEEYGASAVVYSHCHGARRYGDSIRGTFHGIRYLLVSGDYLEFKPALVLP